MRTLLLNVIETCFKFSFWNKYPEADLNDNSIIYANKHKSYYWSKKWEYETEIFLS